MSALTFRLHGDSRQVNTLRQVIKAKLPVLVLKEITVVANTSQYDNQYIEDRMGNIPINSIAPELLDKDVRIVETNTSQEIEMVTTNDIIVEGIEEKLFPPTELRTHDGVVHSLPIELLDLNPGETIQLTARIHKALTGENGRYAVAPVCHFKGVMDEAASAKAYNELPEETKTAEYRKNWDNLYSHQYIVKDSYLFVLEVLPNCGYTNTSAIAAACDIIISGITSSKMWKVKVDDDDTDIVMDEFVGYLFEHALQGKPGVLFVKYGKKHPHDASGTLRVKTSGADVDITKLIQEAVEPMRRFYVNIATGVGGKRLHPQLQKALDAFVRASEAEKRDRLIELGVERERAESAPETDLDTMAEVWLQQTERKAKPTLDMEDSVKVKEDMQEIEEKKEETHELLVAEAPAEAMP